MKQKSVKIVLALTLAVLFLAGCTAKEPAATDALATDPAGPTESAGPAVSDNPVSIEVTPTPMPSGSEGPSASPAETQSASSVLTALLPSKSGFEWVYSGTAEYSQSMTLASISQNTQGTVYSVTGEVGDTSGGESDKDLTFEETYIAGADALVLSVGKGDAMMDSKYTDLELIRLPLKQGNSWEQQAAGSDGTKSTLACTIDSVEKVDGRMEYAVSYKEKDGSYFEGRKIRVGFGVVAFEMQDGGDASPVGYAISEPVSGYEGSAELNSYLPKADTEMDYFGLAEYGHKGTLEKLWSNAEEAVYEFTGEYDDGVGTPDEFVVRYYFDYLRGTVTEKVMSNERTDTAELNSKLHNLVVLKAPIKENAAWSHNATIDGKQVKVVAKVTEMDNDKGTVTVAYTAKGADGYYDDTYIETRTFKQGYGLVSFSNLMPGDIDISEADAKDPEKKADILANHMFGYQLREE